MKITWHLNWAFLVVFVSLGFILPSFSAAEEEPKIEGMIEIDYPFAEEAKVEVNLAGTLFALAAKMVKDDDPETSEFLANLKAIKVRIYDHAALGEREFSEVLKFYEDQLKKGKWDVLARVKEENSRIGVYSLTSGDAVSGLTVLVGEPEQVVIVNLVGRIDIAKLSKLSNLPEIGKIASLASTGTGNQPSFVIKGVVRDAGTGKPIAGAKVSDYEYGPEPRKGATTDSDGKYSYETWYEEHCIVAEAPGYKPQRETLITKFLGKEKEKVMDFALERESD